MNRFRFAVQASAGAESGSRWKELAKKVESLGFSTLFVPDHLDDGQLSPIVAMSVAAMATDTLKVGSLVFNNDYRHPVILAREMVTLDLLSEGRLELGMGAGWKRTDYDQSGIPYDTPGTRIARFSEALEVITSLFKDGTATFHGEYYQIDGAVGLPAPFSVGGPPLIVGGGGRKILGLASKYADIIGVNPSLAAGAVGSEVIKSVGPEKFLERIDWVREASGTRFEDVELQCLTFVAQVVKNAKSWLSEVVPSFGISVEEAQDIPIVLAGSIGEIIETLEIRRERFGLTYWVIHQNEMEAFAPVVAALSGK